MTKFNRPPARVLNAYEDKLRNLHTALSQTALLGTPLSEENVDDTTTIISNLIKGMERKATEKKPAILNMEKYATRAEVNQARKRQAVRHGENVYLPCWSEIRRGIPSSFLRSALFSTGRTVQRDNEQLLAGNANENGEEREIPSLGNISIYMTGTTLCQLDREVYSTCLDYYRDEPLAALRSNDFVKTTFWEFCKRRGIAYGLNSHISLVASLIRLGGARLRVRHDDWEFQGPTLLSVSMQRRANSTEYQGSDELCIQITEDIAELFGPGAWTAVDKKAVAYDGLLGWTANFYASHANGYRYDVDALNRLSGYPGTSSNFKQGLRSALDKLSTPELPDDVRVTSYGYPEKNTI
eukprot:gene22886-24189_t